MTQAVEGQTAVVEHEVYKAFCSILALYRKRIKVSRSYVTRYAG